MQVSPYHVASVKSYVYSYELSVTIAAADMVSVKRLHFGYILYGIIACSLGMFKHHVTFLFALFMVTQIFKQHVKEHDLFICSLLNDSVSNLDYTASNNWLTVNNELQTLKNKTVMTLFEILSWPVSEGNEENHKYIYRYRILRACTLMLNQDMGVY